MKIRDMNEIPSHSQLIFVGFVLHINSVFHGKEKVFV